jgi:VWFA-related protein
MRVKYVVVAVTLALAGAASAFAQSAPPAPPPARPTPTPQSAVHVTTRAVQVIVAVQDDHGRPVTGLTKDDFVVLDQGQRQQIASFSEQTNRVTTAAAAAPNLFTNRFVQGASQPPITVIVIDAYNARYWDLFPQKYGGQCPPLCAMETISHAVEKFISRMQAQDRVALYELTDKLYLLQDFTSDPSALQSALARAKDRASAFRFARSEMYTNDRDLHTMNAMHAVGDRLANVSGRKNLIWLSPGFPPVTLDDGGEGVTFGQMDKTAKTLGNAELPLFAMNPLGLVAGGGLRGGGGAGRAGGPISAADIPTPHMSACDDTTQGCAPYARDFEYSKSLAEDSGGRAFYNTNDLTSAIRKVIDDSAFTYILGYYPDHDKWNGEFREIKVKVSRPGVEVRARKGYYAVADTASAAERDSQKLADTIRSPLESTDLGFDARADGVEVDGVRQLKMKVTVDANQLRIEQRGDRWTDNITETLVQFSAEGEQVGVKSQTINLKPTQVAYPQLLKQGLNFSETVTLEKNAVEIRLVLRDTGNGAIGSVIIPLTRLFSSSSASTQTKK